MMMMNLWKRFFKAFDNGEKPHDNEKVIYYSAFSKFIQHRGLRTMFTHLARGYVGGRVAVW